MQVEGETFTRVRKDRSWLGVLKEAQGVKGEDDLLLGFRVVGEMKPV